MRHSVAEEMFVYPAMQEHLPDGDQAVELVGPGVGLVDRLRNKHSGRAS